MNHDPVLDAVGERLRSLRQQRQLSLARLSATGEVAEFDTRVPHWFGSAAPEPAEVLVLFGPQGERLHVRARPKAAGLPGRRLTAIARAARRARICDFPGDTVTQARLPGWAATPGRRLMIPGY